MTMDRTIRGWCVVMVLAACGGGGNALDPEGTTSGPLPGTSSTDVSSTDPIATTDDAVCHAGYEKCPCLDGLCLDGLVCLSDLCVQPAPEPSSEGGEESSSTSASGDDSSTGAGESSSEDSSTTMALEPCLDDDNYCDSGTLQTCDNGYWEYMPCPDWCALSGYDSPGCLTADACECEGYADPTCYDGAFNLCICADIDFNIPCTDEQLKIFYDECWTMANTYVECFSAYPIDEVADCAPAEAACL